MDEIFMGVVSLYFLIKGIWFIVAKLDRFENIIDDFIWDEVEDE